MKPRILFVDDERNILDSLKLSLRGMREEWEMHFAPGGREALDMLASCPHDVVVTDMRMPGMDGAQLLKAVQASQPGLARIILTGHSDKEAVLKNMSLAHQYLAKPCRTQDLVQAVRNALQLHGVMVSDRLRSVIAGIDSLPALPDCYNDLVEALADDGVSMKRIGDILSRDMALSASVLRVVNCSLFGFPARVSSVHHAASLLGTQILRSLVLSSHLFAAHEGVSRPGFSIRLLWDHSIRVAGFAKRIAEVEGLPEEIRDDCVIAGMLHDIGKLILASSFSGEFAAVLSSVRSEGVSVHAAERNVFGTSHAEVGAYLLGIWGFNHAQMGAVHAHQAPPSNGGTGLSAQFIVSVANSLDHELVRIHRGYALHALDLPEGGVRDFDARIASWREECRNKILEDAPLPDRMA